MAETGALLILVVATLVEVVLGGGVMIGMLVMDEVVGGIDCGWTEVGAEVEIDDVVVIDVETEEAVVAAARLKYGQKL